MRAAIITGRRGEQSTMCAAVKPGLRGAAVDDGGGYYRRRLCSSCGSHLNEATQNSCRRMVDWCGQGAQGPRPQAPRDTLFQSMEFCT